MPILFSKVGKRLSEILKSHGHTIKYFDQFGDKVYDPESATMFFTNNNMMATIFDDDDNSSIQLNISNKDNPKDIKKLIDKVRQLANHFNLMFNVQQYTKTLQPKDFATFAVARVDESSNIELQRWIKIFTNIGKIVGISETEFQTQAERWVNDNIEGIKPSIKSPGSKEEYAQVAQEIIETLTDSDSVLRGIFRKLFAELSKNEVSDWFKNNENKFYGLIDMTIKKLNDTQMNEDWEDDVAKQADEWDNFMNHIWDPEEIASLVIKNHMYDGSVEHSDVGYEIEEFGKLYADIDGLRDDNDLIQQVIDILEARGVQIVDSSEPTVESPMAPINSLHEWIDSFSHDSFIRETKQPLLDKKKELKENINNVKNKIADLKARKALAEQKAAEDRHNDLVTLAYTIVENRNESEFIENQSALLEANDSQFVLEYIRENWNEEVTTQIESNWTLSEGKGVEKDFLVVPRTSIGFTKVKGTPKNVDKSKYIENKKVGDRIRIASKHPSGPITYKITRIKPEGIYGVAIPRSSIKEVEPMSPEFPDTESGAIAALKHMSSYKVKNPSVKPYPNMYGAWLVTHDAPEGRLTSAVYLKGRHNVQNDFEDLDNVFEDTLDDLEDHFIGFVKPDHMEKDLINDIKSTKLPKIKKTLDQIDEGDGAVFTRNPEWDVKIGEILGGTADHPERFKSKVALDCWVDDKWGANIYVSQGDDPNIEGTAHYGSAESANKEMRSGR